MKPIIKFIEPARILQQPYCGPYQDVAVSVRELLDCDYALVALPDKEAIRIQGFAGQDTELYGNPAARLFSQLSDWGPIVVDEARVIVAPVGSQNRILGVLIGYSARPGTFTAGDLKKLMTYSRIAESILIDAERQSIAPNRSTLTTDDLLHLSGLITMGELSACFAHDVANPLTLLRGHLRFVSEGLSENDPLRGNIEAINRASRRIEEMAKRMLAFSKRKTNCTELCDISDVLSEALRFVQPYFRTRFIDIQFHVDPQLPKIPADPGRLIQMIVNLLQNAADAMGDVDLRILAITVSCELTTMRIVISDTGGGIEPDNLRRIYDPFFTTKGSKGTGLGLYITKQIIEQHRGSITVQTGDRGTSFVISLPL